MVSATATNTTTLSRGFTVMCPNCLSDDSGLVHDFKRGDIVCTDCNSAIGDRLLSSYSKSHTTSIRHSEQLKQNENENPLVPAVAATLLSMAGGSSSQSSQEDSDSNSNSSKDAVLSRAQRSRSGGRKASREVAKRRERGLERAYSGITLMCANMDVPSSIGEAARKMYRRVAEEDLHRGKNIDAIVATCIFLACRQQAVPRTFKEICALTHVPRKEISRMFKLLKDRLGEDVGTMLSDDLLARFCSTLSLGAPAQQCASILNDAVKQHDTLAGKSPVSVAGACIYMASHLVGQPRDAGVISHVAGISEGTIKSSYKLLFVSRDLLVTQKMLESNPHISTALLPLV
ncbi:transcription initiation factor IIB [Coemansia sp. RSA 1646]|nr:transcription initiation factor IIB [Coemansia sp. RSA 1646]KAJ1770746.1 transcription initiation factor IIB [Coemansia sp. RSA 1843]KAJ2088768.1 transcription initiation factor IIB [Coemansia sp. RSA 986]KAJ2213704.1 transcription initiation factor IIB [Coemansia sp. RSA 487]